MTIQRSTKDMPMLTTTEHASRRTARRLSLLIALAVTALPLAAQAQRKSPLADAPAIRKRYELRQTRFELGVGGASTVNQDFYHTFFVGVKAAFHFTDWLSLAAFGDFAVANVSTGFQGSVTDALGDTPPIDREPTPAEAKAGDAEDHEHPGRAARVHAVHGKVLALRQAVRELRLLWVRWWRHDLGEADR